MSDLVERYLACWNETDPARRRTLLEQHWAADAAYVDPIAAAEGLDALDATIGAAQAQFAGMVFTQLGDADAHHQQARFSWGLGRPGEAPVVEGFDVVVTDDDGRIARVYGFLDKVPAA
jgi:ketosteroid isomerase-like protein